MSVYLRHSLFWDVWDCYGKLMSEPQKSSMDWCSYIYIFNISPWFTMFFSMEEHLSDMSAVASTAFCSCQRLNPLWWCRAPKLLGSGTHIGDLMGRSGEWLDWARKRDEWRMMDDDGWMMDDDGWWWMMMDDGWWWMYPSMMVFVCLHFRQSSLHKVPLLGPEAQVLRWNLAIATAAKAAKWKRAMSLMLGLNAQALQPDTWITWCWEFTSGKPPKLREYSRKVSLLLFSAAMYHHLDI